MLTLTLDQVRDLQDAARYFEADDAAKCYRACAAQYGDEIAGMGLITLLRALQGSLEDDVQVTKNVNDYLANNGITKQVLNLELPASMSDLARLHDVLFELIEYNDISLDLIHRILLSDRDLLGQVYMYGASDTVVADQFYTYVKENYHLFGLKLKESKNG